MRFAIATFPVPQGPKADPELRRERFLGQSDPLSQGLDVNLRWFVDLYSTRPPFLMGYRFL